jgi:phosphate transport system substrate-binding protein
MQPLLSRLASEFRRRHPEATITIEGGGSAKALPEFLGTEAKKGKKKDEKGSQPLLVASSRKLTASEVKQFRSEHGYEPTEVPIAVDAVAIYVHRDNPLQRLSLDHVDAIFSTTRNRRYPEAINHWGQLGLRNGWEETSIRLYGRDQKSGTRAFVKEHVLQNGEFRPTVREEPGAASVILALSQDPAGIAYSGIGLQTSTVRVVALADHNELEAVLPTSETIGEGSYPLTRFLYLYVKKPSNQQFLPVVKEFLSFASSRDGQETVIKTGFYPVPLRNLEQNMTVLARQ